MTKWIAECAYRLAVWLHPGVQRYAALPPEHMAIAATWVAKAELFEGGTTGDYKRAWVYGKLLKALPTLPKSTVGLLVELAVQEMRNAA